MGGKRWAIYGKPGSGKSYLTRKLAARQDRVIVFDPEEEYGGLPGFMECTTLQEVYDCLYDCWDGTFRIAYVPPSGQEIQKLHHLSLMVEAVGEAYKNGHTDQELMVVVDELNLSFPLTINTTKYSGFARLCSRGRKRGINIIGTTQRPSEVATRWRGNLDRVSVFALAQQIDVEAAAKSTGDKLKDLLSDCVEYGHVLYAGGEFTVEQPV